MTHDNFISVHSVKVWGMLSSERYQESSVNNNKINKY